MFGLNPKQVHAAGIILQQLAQNWRELVAGSEGFLTNEKRRSIFRQNVAWGEMVSNTRFDYVHSTEVNKQG